MGNLNKSAMVRHGFATFRFNNHYRLALTADHLTILRIVGITFAVAGIAVRKRNMDDFVRGTLDNELYLVPRNSSLEEMQLPWT